MAAFVRIGWSLSIGIDGRLPSESVAALPRIPHQSYSERQLYDAALDRLSREVAAVQHITDDDREAQQVKFAVVEGERREAEPGLSAACPVCGTAMIAKCGDIKVRHLKWTPELGPGIAEVKV